MRILIAIILLVFSAAELSADPKFKKIYETCKHHHPTKPLNAQSKISAVNQTTARFLKTELMCRVATEDCLKPLLSQKDNLMVDTHRYTFVELNNDSVPELITGASDETYLHNNKYAIAIFPPGNKDRALRGLNYYFFSSDPLFKAPSDAFFSVVADFVVNDFNADGRDDIFFVHHGPDTGPRKPQKNKIMLSGPDGYRIIAAPGEKSLWHGGTAGDVDNDGDVDVIATPGYGLDVILYKNDGAGSFTYNTLFSGIGRYSSIELWDINKDGHLDILMDGHKTDLMVSWGRGNGKFSQPIVFFKTPDSVVQEYGFADVDNDNKEEIIILSSLSTEYTKKKYNYDMYYGGFEMSVLKVDDKRVTEISTVTRHVNKNGHHVWLDSFSTCDIQNNGTVDLVWEKIGEGNFFPDLQYSSDKNYDWSKTGRIVWFNDGIGNFTPMRFEDPMYFFGNSNIKYNFDENEEYIDTLVKNAEKYDLAIRKYLPHKIYHKSDDGDLFIRNDRNIKPYPFRPLEIE